MENLDLEVIKLQKTSQKLSWEKVSTADGTITAKKKGSCTVYVYAQNGIYKSVNVTVK